jgi:uncharacterized protein (TIGR02271 family)
MADVRQSIVVSAFNNRSQADEAITALQKSGFQNDQIRQFAGKGAGGPLTGIKGIFSSERMARGDITRDLMDMGVAPEDTRFYQQEYEAGHPLVSVASNKRLQEATNILVSHGGYVPRVQAQEQRGTAVRAGSATMGQRENLTQREGLAQREVAGQELYRHSGEEQHMRLHAEHLQASKQPAQVGEVILRKEIVTEQESIDIPVSHEEVIIERRSLAGDVAAAGERLEAGQEIHIPVSEERVDVTKRVVTTEEFVVGKRELQETRHFTDSVQHEEARLEQKGDAHVIWEKGSEQPPLQPGI